MTRNLISPCAAAVALSVTIAGCSTAIPPSSLGGNSPQLAQVRRVAVVSGATTMALPDATSTLKHIVIPTTNSIQDDLISTFPEGTYKPKKGVGTFSIPSTPDTCGYAKTGACNFYDGFTGSGTSITIKADVKDPVDAYTLMNAYSPPSGVQIATIEFVGGRGATVTFPLIAGEDIRDFYNGVYANTLSNGVTGVVANNVFECVDPTKCLGAGATGNVHTGDAGTYRVDEQQFTLSALDGQTLTKIVITDTNSGSTPLLLGLTIKSN
jgi:hypothetical protein